MGYDIGPSIGIEGEAAYKKAIKSISEEMKTLDSALALVDSQFRDQANSMDALTAKGTALQNLYDKYAEKVKETEAALESAKNAQNAYTEKIESSKAQIAAAESALDNLKNSTGDTADEQKKLVAEISKLSKELKEAENAETAAVASSNKWQRELNNAKVKLNDLDNEIKQNKQYMTEADNATDKCATSIDNYGKQVKQTAAETDKAANNTVGMTKAVAAGGIAANLASQAISAVVSAAKQLGSQALETADQLIETAEVTGKSVEELQQLQYVIDDVGGSTDTYNSAQKKLIKSMDEAKSGTTDYANAFETLKVDAVDPATGALRDSNDVMYEVIDALGSVANETERDALAMQLFGKSATELNPLIKAGSEELKRLSDEAKNSGAVMSEDTVDALDSFGDSLDHLKQQGTAFVGEVLAGIVSGGKTAAESMQDLSDGIDKTQSVMELIDQYEQLQTELANSELSEEEAATKTEELNKVKQELIDVSGGVVTALGLENGSYDEQVTTLEGLNEAQQEIYKQQLAALVLANTGAEAEKKRTEAIAESTRLYDEYIDALKNSSEVAQGDGITQFFDGIALFDTTLKSAAEKAVYFKQKTDEAAEGLEQLGIDSAMGAEATAKLVEVCGSAGAAAEYLGITIEDLNTRLAGTADTIGQLSAAEQDAAVVADSFAQSVDALQTSYNEMYAAASDAVNSTISLWEEMDASAIKTAEQVNTALQSQIDWLNNYDDNLTALENREISGVDLTPLLTSLADGTEESAEILSGLRIATDDEIKQIVESFNRVGEGKDTLASNMAQVKTEFLKNIDTMTQEAIAKMAMAGQAGKAAIDTMQGYIDGIYAKRDDVIAAFRDVAESALSEGHDKTMDRHSPSRVMGKAAEDDWDGFIIASKKKQAEIEETFAESASKANRAAQTSMPSIITEPASNAGAQTAALTNAISSLSSGSRNVSSGGVKTLIIEFKPQLDARTLSQETFEYDLEYESLRGSNQIE